MARGIRTRGERSPWLQGSKDRARAKKTAQLCAVARRALGWAIQVELDDARITELMVAEVRPHPDASHLLVIATGAPGTDLTDAERRLRRAGGVLREALARELSRKRVPALSFVVLPEGTRRE